MLKTEIRDCGAFDAGAILKYVILATFRLRLYPSRIQRVENYVLAKVITKEILHNHVFTEFGGGARIHNHVFT